MDPELDGQVISTESESPITSAGIEPGPINADPLVSLGLVDPKTGAALETSDWKPSGATAVAERPAVEAPKAESTPQEPAPAPVAQPVVDPRVQLQTFDAQLQAQAAQMYATLTTAGDENGMIWEPKAAENYIRAQMDLARSQAHQTVRDQAIAPEVKHAAAVKLIKEHAAGVDIKPDEIVNQPTLEAMRARVQTLAEVRRDANFQQRKVEGRDRVEGAPHAAVAPNYDDLEIGRMIALGIARGQ